MLNTFFSEFYGFFILMFNIYIYTFLTFYLFFVIFSSNLVNLKGIRSLTLFFNSAFLYSNLLVIFLSFAGIPPFSGFFGKFFIVTFLFGSSNYFFLFFFIFFNFFVLYFYVQNFKFIAYASPNREHTQPFFVFNRVIFIFIFIFFFFNSFFFFFFNDLFFYFLAMFVH